MPVARWRGLVGSAFGALALVVGVSAQGATAASRSRIEVVVKTHHTTALGTYLTTVTGLPLYTRATDPRTRSTCVRTCLRAWPILSVAAGKVPTGVWGIGDFRRPDGRLQVDWVGHPLYRFAGDHPYRPSANGRNGFHLAVLTPPPGT